MTQVDQSGDELSWAVASWTRLFNQGRYFEAHEVLEKPWLSAMGPEKNWLKGLIHAAVALHHYERGNAHGARVKSASCRRYLTGCHQFAGVDIAALVADLERFFLPLHDPSGAALVPDPGRERPQANQI